MVKNDDQESVLADLEVLELNLGLIARRADNHFIDPNVRPKEKRVRWTEKSYLDGIRKRLAWFREDNTSVPWAWKRRALFGVKDFTMQVLNNEFQRFRDIWVVMHTQYVDPSIDVAKKEQLRTIRNEQAEMEPFDRARKCPGCGRPIFIRDLQNNYIDLKRRASRAVCGAKDDDACSYANASRKLREMMVPEITKVRSERDDAKEAEKQRKEKKQRLHGTTYDEEVETTDGSKM